VDTRKNRGVPQPPPSRTHRVPVAPKSQVARRVPATGEPPKRPKARAVHSLVILVLVVAIAVAFGAVFHITSKSPNKPAAAAQQNPGDPPLRPLPKGETLRQRIVSVSRSQLGYRTDPPDTYCNQYSAYFVAGTDDCGNSNLDEEWCADFAAWVWLKAGALVNYQFINGDINSSAASFYEWGVAHGTWHPVGSGYVPQPGDVAVYGLNISTPSNPVAAHVAIVTGYTSGKRGPDVVNGDGDRTGFSVVEIGTDQYTADASGAVSYLSGYTSPTPVS
jgi:hypothetical protein